MYMYMCDNILFIFFFFFFFFFFFANTYNSIFHDVPMLLLKNNCQYLICKYIEW